MSRSPSVAAKARRARNNVVFAVPSWTPSAEATSARSGVAMVAGSRPAAEDAVQEALARAWERSERGEEIDSLTAWVTVVSLNLARSRLRRVVAERRARERMGSRAGTAAPGPLDAGERIDVLRALASLPRRQREATVLRYYLGLNTSLG